MAAAVPVDAVIVAGIDLDRLRGSAIYGRLPAAVTQALGPYAGASRMVAAWDSQGLLILARGDFQLAPAGATLVSPHLAIGGADDSVRAAMGRYRSPGGTRSGVLGYGMESLGTAPLWIAMRGGTALPFTGNAVNLARLLRLVEYAGIAVKPDRAAEFRIRADAATADAAQRFEESLRAFFSLAAVGETHRPDLAALLEVARVERKGRVVTATLQVPAEKVGDAIAALVP